MRFSHLQHATALRPHPAALPPAAARPAVQARWQLSPEGYFDVTFRVTLPAGAAWNTNPDFSRTDYRANWGLWEHDVVELFLQPRPHPDATAAPYLEVQVSPLGQPFALLIEEPARHFAPPPALAYLKEIVLEPAVWQTRLRVQVPDYAPGAPLFGNLTACLGPAGARTYWGLQLSAGPEPDFHRPVDFGQLI
ncbi:hypothetical protein E5K00_11715 [Hymenobacter aquaticus]|uniref:Carbohydrate-binding domain-containing protein n=1 Tax=Hymenobacter aquaticus TaxID=1867101 RepID=A0A4Z0Q9J3_9BACT|nr:hypothetical protein [Hymenobacter aquaticus]TGE25823.1 hypothetical protein E5K00_11715 [Hymenobacter aquaticus]